MIKAAKGWQGYSGTGSNFLAFTEDVTGALAIPKKMTQYIVALEGALRPPRSRWIHRS